MYYYIWYYYFVFLYCWCLNIVLLLLLFLLFFFLFCYVLLLVKLTTLVAPLCGRTSLLSIKAFWAVKIRLYLPLQLLLLLCHSYWIAFLFAFCPYFSFSFSFWTSYWFAKREEKKEEPITRDKWSWWWWRQITTTRKNVFEFAVKQTDVRLDEQSTGSTDSYLAHCIGGWSSRRGMQAVEKGTVGGWVHLIGSF